MRYAWWLLLGIVFACGPPDHSAIQNELMDRRLKERVDDFITTETAKCKVDLLEKASAVADSILRATNPILIQIDSLERPAKPVKPEHPDFARPTDSISISPIIPKQPIKKDQ